MTTYPTLSRSQVADTMMSAADELEILAQKLRDESAWIDRDSTNEGWSEDTTQSYYRSSLGSRLREVEDTTRRVRGLLYVPKVIDGPVSS